MKMNGRIAVSSIMMLVVFLTITEGKSLRGLGHLRCRCINTESRRIGRLIETVELFPPTSHCRDTEIIATLKETGQELCLDPTATWVKKVVERMILANRRRR